MTNQPKECCDQSNKGEFVLGCKCPRHQPKELMEWEKRFDERWNWASFTWNGDNKLGERSAKKTRRSIKTFVKSLLSLQKQQLIEKVEGIGLLGIDIIELKKQVIQIIKQI